MEFEEMQIIWDAQNKEPLFAINQAEMRARIASGVREFNRGILWRDVREIGIGLVVGVLYIFGGVGLLWAGAERVAAFIQIDHSPLDVACLLLGGVIWLYYSAYQFIGRKNQQRHEQQYESSLTGDLDRSLAQIDYQIKRTKNVLWWGLLPIYAASGLGLFVVFDLTPKNYLASVPFGTVAVVVMLAALVVDYRCKSAPIKNELLPRKRDLESLRKKLETPID